MAQAQVGLIGLGTMGSNLARNLASRGTHVAVFNRTSEKTKAYLKNFGNEYITGKFDLPDFVVALKKPRRIILLVPAGTPVDEVVDELLPLLAPGDLIIDGGNSNYHDTMRRFTDLQKKNIHFLGCGVSGGEEGALYGPSLMPGGSNEGYKMIKDIFEKIAAKDFAGKPCVAYIGDTGAGHYVKMVHNGIEYGIMQLMAEAYDLLRSVYRLPAPQIAEVFARFQAGKLNSYLFAIAIPVLTRADDRKREKHLIDSILDTAAQKGTGGWAAIDAIERGVAIPSIAEAVSARVLSSAKEARNALSRLYKKAKAKPTQSQKKFTALLEEALYASLLATYAQGYDLIAAAARGEHWQIDLAEISRIWEGGCIIRAQLLNTLHRAYAKAPSYTHLFALPSVRRDLKKNLSSLRALVATSAISGVAVPGLSSSLAYIEGITSGTLPTNLIQGLRDYFGAHGYERTDQSGVFHTDWN